MNDSKKDSLHIVSCTSSQVFVVILCKSISTIIKMKLFLIISMLVVLVVAAPPENEKKLCTIDFDALFADDDMRKKAFDCLLDIAPCGDLQTFKGKVMKFARTNCADCSPEQKEKFDKVFKMLHDNYESVFNEFMKKVEASKTA